MPALIIIPARYASTRFEGKPLAPLRGAGGQATPLVARSWQAAMAARQEGDEVIVATDDERIRQAAEAAGADCILTSSGCANGTERCAAALAAIPGAERFDVIVNLQGDAPLTPPWFVQEITRALRAAPDIDVATPVLRCSGPMVEALRADRTAGRVGGTTAALARDGRALYFSKEVIPCGTGPASVRLHAGVYAYRPAALRAYPAWPVGELEATEGLEQLRFLENGTPVLGVEVEARGRPFWEVNNPSDVERVEHALAGLGIA